jgi:hypothetical protein
VLAAANAEDVGKWKWELEQRRDFIFTLSYKQSASINNKTGTILVPFDGAFESQQDPIPVSIQKKADEFDRSDLLQKWKNGSEFLFSDVMDDVADLIALLKEKSANSDKFVHFYFPSGLNNGQQKSNHIVVDASGFVAKIRGI